MRPLADEIRPQTLDEVAGQKHLLGEGALLRRLIESGAEANLIFYGPSGTGKTTIANIIARRTKKTLYHLNATTASLQDVKAVISDVDTMLAPNGVLLYLDEIQYFNKKQQQSLLEFMENGKITLIASTTENPFFYVYNALLSRSTVFEFKALTPEETVPAVERALALQQQRSSLPLSWEEEVPRLIAAGCGGDVRKAVNAVELLYQSAKPRDGGLLLTTEDAQVLAQRSAMRYDREGDQHYDLLSALQKSIRGSDPDAAVYYLGRLLAAGDLLSPCRRLLVIAAEDVGLAYPQAIVVTKACVDAALQLGLPEGRLPLAEAAGHSSQVQFRPQCHHCRHAGHRPRQGGAGATALAECPRRQRRNGEGPDLQISPRLPQSLCKAAILARPCKGRCLLRIRPQQNRAGRQALLGRDQGR